MSQDLIKFEPEDQLPAEIKDELEEKSAENMEGVQPRLPKVQMPTGRGKEFLIEQHADEDLETTEIVGIILYQTTSNAYWSEPFGGGGDNVLPDCASHDGVAPSDQYPNLQSSTCSSCAHNKFGSARDPQGNKRPGKACRNVKRVVLLRVDDPTIPALINVPPSSIKAFDDYMVLLRKKKRPYYTVATGFTLKTEKNRDSIEFPHIQLEIKGFINSKETLDKLLKDKEHWLELLKSTLFQQDDVAENPSNGTSFTPENTNATAAPNAEGGVADDDTPF